MMTLNVTRTMKAKWVLGALAVFLATSEAQARVPGTITQLSVGDAVNSQASPAISGDSVVWGNRERGAMGGANLDIFYRDLAGGPATNITATADEQEYLEDVDGTLVVYTRSTPTAPGDIMAFDTVSATASPVVSSIATRYYQQPAIDGRYIVFTRVTTQFDIEGYDYFLGSPLPLITNDAADQFAPRISGDVVVYEDYGSGNPDVHGYRISTSGPPFPIASGPASQSAPDVDGNWVVWVERVSGTDQIMAHNLQTSVTTPLTTTPSIKFQPRVSGSRVVWADDRSGNLDIYSYDLATGVEDVVVDGPMDQTLNAIDGNRIVYVSNETGFESIFLFTITVVPPPPPIPLGCDPARTDLVSGPVTLTRTGQMPQFAVQAFAPPQSGKTLYACVENGKPDGSERTRDLLMTVGLRVVLTSSNFAPSADPPRYVTAEVSGRRGPGLWTATLFGANVPSTVKISLRSSR